jgi:diguanylate cyclase (GGDEF)-like protein/PAS domain S-box-containing protein
MKGKIMNNTSELPVNCDDMGKTAEKWDKPDKLLLKLTLITLFTFNFLFLFQLTIHYLSPNIKISYYDIITNLYLCLAVNIAACLILYRHQRMVKLVEQELASRLQFEQALQEATGLLEQRVAERTADLERANQALRLEISERERVEGELRSSEASYRLLVSQMPSVLFKGYADWSIDFFDNKVEELTGYPKEEFDARNITWSDVIVPEDLENAKEIFKRALKSHQAYVREYRIKGKSDKVLWIRERAQIICDEQGRIDYVSGVFYDITQRHEMALELKKSEEKYRLVFENAPLGILHFDQMGIVTDCNERFAEIIGAPKEKIIGFDMPRQLEDEKLREGIMACLDGKYSSYEGDYLSVLGGKVTPVRAILQGIVSRNGETLGGVGIFEDITQHRQAENGLKKSLSLLHATLESTADGILVVNSAGKIVSHNQKFLELWNLSESNIATGGANQVISSVLELLRYPVDFLDKVKDLEAHPEAESYDVLEFLDGRIYERYSQPQRLGGEIVGRVWSFRDITERRQAEAALDKLRMQNEMILNSAGEGIFGLDLMGRITFSNPTTSILSGYDANELLGQSFFDLIRHQKPDGTPYPEEDCPIYCTLRDGKRRHVADDVFWTKEGQPMPVEYVITPIEERGKVVGAVGVFRDVTERKRAEEEIKRAYEYLEKIFDNSADGVGIVDEKGNITKWNKAAEDLYGYTFEELLGQSAFNLYPDKNELNKMLSQLRQKGFLRNYEINMRKKNGSIIPCSLSIKMLKDIDDRIIGSVTVARDLTEVKQHLANLKLVNEKLQNSVTEADQRNRQMAMLQQMGEVLQACQTLEEIYDGIAHFATMFFPDFAGALYSRNNSKNLFEMVANWGEKPPPEQVFGHDECWALRRSRMNLVDSSASLLRCRHVSSPVSPGYLCVPMIAQGEALGILHLRKISPAEVDRMQPAGQLASTVAEGMALALANMKLRETLHDQAIRDPLTGLFNRRYMIETFERELARAQRHGISLTSIMIDLDKFKIFNDTFGHDMGDKLLTTFGDFIRTTIRKEDIACRWGGEEFFIILPGVTLKEGLERTEEIRSKAKKLQVASGQPHRPVSLSIGIAVYPDHGATTDVLIKAADNAMYKAKKSGRDRVITAHVIPSQVPEYPKKATAAQ